MCRGVPGDFLGTPKEYWTPSKQRLKGDYSGNGQINLGEFPKVAGTVFIGCVVTKIWETTHSADRKQGEPLGTVPRKSKK
jgi:hypothetical protein